MRLYTCFSQIVPEAQLTCQCNVFITLQQWKNSEKLNSRVFGGYISHYSHSKVSQYQYYYFKPALVSLPECQIPPPLSQPTSSITSLPLDHSSTDYWVVSTGNFSNILLCFFILHIEARLTVTRSLSMTFFNLSRMRQDVTFYLSHGLNPMLWFHCSFVLWLLFP